jgi:hypothetical protein
MAVLKQGDYVLWQDGSLSGVGRVSIVEEGIAHYSTYVWVKGLANKSPDVKHLPIEYCTKIDPAIAKVYGHDNV